MVNVTPTWSIGLNGQNGNWFIVKIGNCNKTYLKHAWDTSYLIDPLFGSIIKAIGYPFWSILQILAAWTPSFKISKNYVRLFYNKIITFDNVIIVFVFNYQLCDNFVHNCLFNILMFCTTIIFHFLHKHGLNIRQTPNFLYILRKFNFHY